MAFLKEMEVIATKRSELTTGAKGGSELSSEIAPKAKPKPGPKKKGRGKGAPTLEEPET